MDDDEELVDFGPQTKTDFRKAEVAKFKNSKKPKKLVKQNRHRWQSFNERLDGVQVRQESCVRGRDGDRVCSRAFPDAGSL